MEAFIFHEYLKDLEKELRPLEEYGAENIPEYEAKLTQ